MSLSILTPKGRCTVRVGKVPQLKVPLLIGRDCPLYKELQQMTLCTGQRGSGLSITRQQPGYRSGAGKQRKKKTKSKPEVVALQGNVASASSSGAEEEYRPNVSDSYSRKPQMKTPAKGFIRRRKEGATRG
jgi:hypothetical protein